MASTGVLSRLSKSTFQLEYRQCKHQAQKKFLTAQIISTTAKQDASQDHLGIKGSK